MSKYNREELGKREDAAATLTFEEIGKIAGVPLDHSFLQYKKELTAYGWQVRKISMKGQTVLFERTGGTTP